AEYTYNGKKYLLPKNDGKNSIHGLVRDINFDYETENTQAIFTTVLNDASYPGSARISIIYKLEKNRFTTGVIIESLDHSIPVEVGFHPYFHIEKPYSINYKSSLKMMNYIDDYFPDGTYKEVNLKNNDLSQMSLDNTFLPEDNSMQLKYGNHVIAITRNNMPYIVLYNGSSAGSDSIAIEPMTGAPDVYHNHIGLAKLEPGEKFECSYSISLR
ncbi:MAG: hypothetical protein QXZ44_07275, partial [Ferroplasma sp.]